MKLAIIAVTVKGAALAAKLSQGLDCDAVVYAKEGRLADSQALTYSSLQELLHRIFKQFDGFICIMAAGIAVRVLAPLLGHKSTDPAVVVVDDGGNYAISLLSGHLGGANELTNRVAQALGALPVITTATDVAGKVAPDVLSGKLGLKIETLVQAKAVNAALANGGKVDFFLDNSLPQVEMLREKAAEFNIALNEVSMFSVKIGLLGECDAAVFITDKLLECDVPHVFLRPPTLVIGLGCRRGTDVKTILRAVQEATGRIGRSNLSICCLASVDIKEDEAGLLAAGRELGAELRFFDKRQLQQSILDNKLCVSEFVQKQIGVGNVCEAAALLAARNVRLMLAKTKFPQVTVAIAEAKFM